MLVAGPEVQLNVIERLLPSGAAKIDIYTMAGLPAAGLSSKRKKRQPGRLRRAGSACLRAIGALIPVATIGSIGALTVRNKLLEARQ